MRRVAFIGLDGMSWRVLATYKESFKEALRLAAEATSGVCSSIPPYTPPSWTSISTGVRPEKHGILGFTRPSFMTDKRFAPLSSLDVKFPRISEILSLNGMKSLVVNHVLSYPPTGWYLKNQVLVSDDRSPKTFIYPPHHSKFLRYFVNETLDVRTSREHFLPLLRDQVQRQVEGVQELGAQVDPDFLWVVFTAPDLVLHRFPHVAAGSFDSLVARVFAIIDEFIGNVSRTYDYLFIASDHGFDIYPKRINAYGLLAQSGLFPRPSMKSRILSSLMSTQLFELMTLCGIKSRLTTGDGLRAMRRLVFPGIGSAGSENLRGGSVMMTDDVDPDDAFVFHFPNERMRDLCIRVLSRKLGTMFECIRPASTDGRHYSIILVPAKELHYDNRFELRGRSILRLGQALHSPAGMYILHGPGVSREVRTIQNIDAAPTLASISKVPLPLHYEGQSLVDSNSTPKGYLDRWRVARKAYWLR